MAPIFGVGISLECSLAVSDRSFVMTRICVIGRIANSVLSHDAYMRHWSVKRMLTCPKDIISA